MTRYEVIESKAWKRDDGATASIYGAVPWVTPSEEKRWKLVTRGYTVRDSERGTVGIGRQPWATRAEAQAWIDKETARLAELEVSRQERIKKTPAQLQREIDEALAQKPKRKGSRRSHATVKTLSGSRYKVFEYRNQREPVAEFSSLRLAKAYALERSAGKLKWDTRKELRREGAPWVTSHYSDDRYFIEEA